ncbi:Membrane-associated protein, putative [Shewanella piezotolerans WP3]|uniref:Membrane-associated protein, putative n=1 Tax=Shewanella piezotolerans (strain WP3 / JCM 13877) TaxID=225849 RepID=B8CQ64_SHEPW|nr:DoxX family protein [Shewanella piezotolerans]ACJ30194.1 Membrane-associated protein, putative [Shewanella piezotolerans WP3]
MKNTIFTKSENTALLIGRVLIIALFMISGLGKIANVEATQGYMAAMGMPASLIWPAIALEVGGALAVLLGFFTRPLALPFAVYSVISALVFHSNFDDQMQAINFWKNISIAAGFIFLWVSGPGRYSLEAWLANRK